MANDNDRLVVAYYVNAAAAEAAAEDLKDWDKANDDIKLGAIGIITLNPHNGERIRVVRDLLSWPHGPSAPSPLSRSDYRGKAATYGGHSYETFGSWYDSSSAGGGSYTRKSLRAFPYRHQNAPFRDAVTGASDTFLILDAMEPEGAPYNHQNFPNPLWGHGMDGANVVFCDGHAEWITRKMWNQRYNYSEDCVGIPLTPFY